MSAFDLDPLRPLHGRARVFSSPLGITLALASMESGDFLVCSGEARFTASVNATLNDLQRAGCAAVIARDLPEAFQRAAINGGLPPLLVEEAPAILDGDRLRVDVEGHKVANLNSGDRYVIRNLYDVDLDVLRAGGLAAFRAVMDDIKRRKGM